MSHLSPVPNDPEQLRAWLLEHNDIDLVAALANREVELPEPPTEAYSLTVKVTLLDTDPPVWRRVVVPGDITLDDLHDVVQTAMGWTDHHLHRFHAGDSIRDPYLVTEEDLDEGEEGTPEADVRLDQLLREVGDAVLYEYDFGDGWEHRLVLEAIDPLGEDVRPRCTGGRRACPPEDVGGPPGYAALAAWVRAGSPPGDVPDPFESYEHAVGWLPLDWDPDAFDVEDTDLRLQADVASGALLERLRPAALSALLRLSPAGAMTVSGWVGTAAQTSLSASDLEELTAPYRQLLAVIGGGAELTASKYLRPPVVSELCTVLAIDPLLVGTASSEARVRPLALFRKVVQQTGLLHASAGLLMPTVAGIRYGDDPHGLWQHVADRLPTGRADWKTDIGWFTLLALAGGVRLDEVFDAVHALTVDAGWMTKDQQPLSRWDVVDLVWPTLAAVVGPRWNSHDGEWPPWVPAAAASVVFADGVD